MAIDYGKKRTGIAVTDELQLIASGLTTVATPELFRFLSEYFDKESVGKVIIGKPKRLNNEDSAINVDIEKFKEKFIKTFPKTPIESIDERFTSKMATQSMLASGLKKKHRRNKALVDEIAATILLQDYLQYYL